MVCFLPPNVSSNAVPISNTNEPSPFASRSQRCSSFLIYDHFPAAPTSIEKQQPFISTGLLREVDLGDAPSSIEHSPLSPRERDMQEAEVEAKRNLEMKNGVRICRDCLNTVMNRQKKLVPKRIENWMRLYQVRWKCAFMQ